MARARHISWTWVLRAALFALLLPLASAGALPSWVAMLVPEAHICHCAVEHHECFCIKCHPDQHELALSEESISGHCGDDDTPFAAGRVVGTMPPRFTFVDPTSVEVGASAVPWLSELHDRLSSPPPTPPPEPAV